MKNLIIVLFLTLCSCQKEVNLPSGSAFTNWTPEYHMGDSGKSIRFSPSGTVFIKIRKGRYNEKIEDYCAGKYTVVSNIIHVCLFKDTQLFEKEAFSLTIQGNCLVYTPERIWCHKEETPN